MFEMDKCPNPSCTMTNCRNEDELSVMLSMMGQWDITDPLDFWECPTCRFDYTQVWFPSELIWQCTDWIPEPLPETSPGYVNFLCCDTYSAENQSCFCGDQITYTDIEMSRYMAHTPPTSYYENDDDYLDCRSCTSYISRTCKPYVEALYKDFIDNVKPVKVTLCTNYKFNNERVNDFPAGAVTADLMAMEVDKLKHLTRSKKKEKINNGS